MVIKNSSIKQSLLTLFISLFITILVSYFTCQETKKKLENEFSILCNELTLNIENRIILHAQILQNTSSFISSSDTITKKEWSSFLRNSKIDKNTPGFQGIGFNVIVPKDQLETHSEIFKNIYKN